MKTLGEAALELPWLAPSVASLTSLARFPLSSIWSQLRTDPGIVLLLARSHKLPACELSLFDAILQHQPHFNTAFVDWNQPGAAVVHRGCFRHALMASRLAEQVDRGARSQPAEPTAHHEVDRAWIAGFLAPLGWLALTAANPLQVANHLAELERHPDLNGWQRQTWGHDHTAIARRLSRSWRLPAWLTSVIGHLGLHVNIAERLGADRTLFQVVQLTALLIQQRERCLGLSVGTSLPELLSALRMSADEADTIVNDVWNVPAPQQVWESPAKHALLADFLRMARDQRRQNDGVWIERLQQDLDHLQEALVTQGAEDERRLQAMKLAALAEFAAGAGHEINNPLAVISGQAQYVLKQLDWLDGPADEIENVGEYLDHLRATITPSLQKIITQTQRVHSILTELMQFARPNRPKPQAVSVTKLMREAIESLRSFAVEHKVELSGSDPADDSWVHVDPGQARMGLVGLLKNAIEAAPAGGWARVRAENERPGLLDLIVEDSGGGPPLAVREHMFDPFFSGRSAGRGRGMGLPTAARLARQQGGDVRFDGAAAGVTRFVLTLPMTAPPAIVGPSAEANGRNGVHAARV